VWSIDERADSRLEITDATSAAALEAVRALFREYGSSTAFESAFHETLALQHFEDELARLPGPYVLPEGRLLLATYAAAPAGCVAFRRLEPGICEMKRLYVRPAFRAHGLGRILAESIIAAARDAGYRAMRLDTLPSMLRAQALYTSLGFHEIAPYCENPVKGAVFMELVLTSEI
jgi:ribosomal protein S18 acetylase RimI-like enzyme